MKVQEKSWAAMVQQFNQNNSYPDLKKPGHPSDSIKVLRLRLMMEELGEVSQAMHENNLIEVADGLCDLLYVVVGTAVEYGMGPILEDLFEEVHRSNMTKFQGETLTATETVMNPVNDKYSGKVRKSANYEPPDLASIIDGYLDTLKCIEESGIPCCQGYREGRGHEPNCPAKSPGQSE